jgi:hypothetical protein
MTLKFLRNKVVEVEPRPEGDLAVSWRLTDDLMKVEVDLIVRPPELEIVSADARFERYVPEACKNASENIKKIEGVGVGGGLRKIVGGLLGGPDGCSLLVDAVLESANAVILHFTRPGIELGEGIAETDEKLAGLRQMVKANPRLIRSCISFQDDSPIMKEIGL